MLIFTFFYPILQQNQRQPASPKSQRVSSILVPLGGDICHSLNLFCVPSLKPVLWAASISSFGLYAPVFLMVSLLRFNLKKVKVCYKMSRYRTLEADRSYNWNLAYVMILFPFLNMFYTERTSKAAKKFYDNIKAFITLQFSDKYRV